MTKVYMVVSGEYEDFALHAVFSTNARALRYIRTIREGDGAVEVFIVDGEHGKVIRPAFRVWMSMRSGKITFKNVVRELARPRAKSLPPELIDGGGDAIITSFVSFPHAAKLAATYYRKHRRIRETKAKG